MARRWVVDTLFLLVLVLKSGACAKMGLAFLHEVWVAPFLYRFTFIFKVGHAFPADAKEDRNVRRCREHRVRHGLEARRDNIH
jgi:hypothetical protein